MKPNIYITSDTHYHHRDCLEIIPSRKKGLGVLTVEEMNAALVYNYNSVVNPDDTVIFLGDVIMGNKPETIPQTMPWLPGNKVLLIGNHDRGFKGKEETKEAGKQLYLSNGFTAVFQGCQTLANVLAAINVSIDLPYEINVCHFPYKGVADHRNGPTRYLKHQPDLSDTLLLCGHTHSSEAILGPSMIHIGVDATMWNYTPVELNKILDLAAKIK